MKFIPYVCVRSWFAGMERALFGDTEVLILGKGGKRWDAEQHSMRQG